MTNPDMERPLPDWTGSRLLRDQPAKDRRPRDWSLIQFDKKGINSYVGLLRPLSECTGLLKSYRFTLICMHIRAGISYRFSYWDIRNFWNTIAAGVRNFFSG